MAYQAQDRPWELVLNTLGQARHRTTEGHEGGALRVMRRPVAQDTVGLVSQP